MFDKKFEIFHQFSLSMLNFISIVEHFCENCVPCVLFVHIQSMCQVLKLILICKNVNIFWISSSTQSNMQMTMREHALGEEQTTVIKRLTLCSVESQMVTSNDGKLKSCEKNWKIRFF